VVSNVLSIDENLAVALESSLGAATQFLIVNNLETAQKASRILREEEKGKATFIPLNQLRSSYDIARDSMAKQTTCSNQYKALKQLLLGHIVLVNSIDEGYRINYKNPELTAVTHKGDVITRQGFLNSGSQGKNVGLKVGLKDKIQKLDTQISNLEKKQRNRESVLVKIQQQVKHLDLKQASVKVKQAEENLQKSRNELDTVENKIQIYATAVSKQQNRLEQIESQISTLKQKRSDFSPKTTQLEKDKQQLEAELETLEKERNEVDEKRVVAQNRFNDARLKHQELSHNVKSFERDIQRAENGIEQFNRRIQQRKESIRDKKGHITVNKARIEELKEDTAAYLQERSEVHTILEQVQKTCRTYRGEINQLEKNLKELRKQKDTHVDLLHSLNLAYNELEMKAKTIADHVWEQYELLMNQVKETLPDNLTPEEGKNRLNYLKEKLQGLGTTNPLSIEEYEEEKKRLDFYEDQIEDLAQAREKLLSTIEEINKTANERFNNIFAQIRSNFKKVFKTLFHEDDYCDLLIEQDAEDPLEAKIEIKANPKGKRPSSINQLSGGEKTLTAIALLFAIYLVKPSPFCVLDEVDAPLDDANIERFSKMLKKFSDFTQFIIITHNKKTMAKSKMVYGVTMPETGISRLVGVKLEDVEDFHVE